MTNVKAVLKNNVVGDRCGEIVFQQQGKICRVSIKSETGKVDNLLQVSKSVGNTMYLLAKRGTTVKLHTLFDLRNLAVYYLNLQEEPK